MESAIAALKDTPVPTILVIAGIVFLLLAIAGQLAGRIAVAPERQRWAAIIGGLLLVIGVALHVLPQVKLTPRGTDEIPTSRPAMQPTKDQPPQSSGVSPSKQPPSESSVQASTEDKEPNDDNTTATVITEGTTVRGLIATDQDQDFFRFNPSGDRTRVILRTQSGPGFVPIVIIYDHVEHQIAMHPSTVLKPATFSFESIPGSVYYIVVKTLPGTGARGNYELVVRKE
jgi:hypothetical protein